MDKIQHRTNLPSTFGIIKLKQFSLFLREATLHLGRKTGDP